MKVLIRNGLVEDAKTISSIGVVSWQKAYCGIVPDEYLDSLSIEERGKHIIRSLSIPTNRFLIAEVDGQAVGMACFYPLNSETVKDVWELEALYLMPEYWNRGIGRELIHYVFQCMRENKACTCNLWVLSDNHRARRFYEHAGLKCTGIEKTINIGGKELIEVCYSISLCQQ